jgi:non-ribosomal peptide synthetase-like protein
VTVVDAPLPLPVARSIARPSLPTVVLPHVFASAGRAPAARTLIDILTDTVQAHPTAAAIDDGTTKLSYRTLASAVDGVRIRLSEAGIGVGDRVGIRIPSGTAELYVSILAVLAVGAAYVPVDVDDPDERAELVFGEAGVSAVLTGGAELVTRRITGIPNTSRTRPRPDDDAWIIFTSGSTGKPKGVAVSHRSAAAFVDAEARLFAQDEPIGPGDRVLAGLSVAFDASCEEMWLAWRHGACLVPAPRSLVRTGVDLAPWLTAQGITVVSTVPTLAALWPAESMEDVRLLIFGGESCPPELAERLAVEGREVWNTYGPTEATVVACAARLTGVGPVRIGLPLDGWNLAVVNGQGEPVGAGETGELVIGGVGLARYLDPVKDAQKYAPMPTLGWPRAYRSGDLVRNDPQGLLFLGRTDEQVKLGGRRIELGEVDAALQALPGAAGGAATVRTTAAGNQVLVGYVATASRDFDKADALARLRESLPAALVPLLAVVDTLPTRTSGKVDRAALPWPLPGLTGPAEESDEQLSGTIGWLAQCWSDLLGVPVTEPGTDFFANGGGSLAAAQLVSVLRARFPQVTVADVYAHPTLGGLAGALGVETTTTRKTRKVTPTPLRARVIQSALLVPVSTLIGLRWLTGLAALSNVLGLVGHFPWAPTISWWWVAVGWLLLVSPVGRLGIAAGSARVLLRGLRPGRYPRGGGVHLRLWLAERVADASGAGNLAGAPWISYYARALGASVGKDVDLHAMPPITGMLKMGRGSSVEPEVDLSGHWLDGDVLHVGRIRIGAGATIGSRSTLFPGARIGRDAEVTAGSSVSGAVRAGERWAGSPAARIGRARHTWPVERPHRSAAWVAVYGTASILLSVLPLLAAVPGLAVLGRWITGAHTLGAAGRSALLAVPLATVVSMVAFALLVLVSVRVLSIGLRRGHHPVRSRIGLQAWATERLMDSARTMLFPLYASLFTPVWLRLLGARIGRGVEASTVLALPSMTTVGDGAFLADDTMIASYELGGGWLRIGEAKVGKRAFLGNSGMTAPGRAVPKNGLVAVLSATPKGAKAGSSWLGSPPVKLRRVAGRTDGSRTFNPPPRLKLARTAVELCRIVPVMCTVALGVGVLLLLAVLADRFGFLVAALLSGLVVLAAGVLAGAVATLAKWSLVGRFRAVEHPLWSSFVWRTELADTFVEMLAVPWLANRAMGTPLLNVWLRSLGAKIGRGVWCETYWLPESDLVRLGDGAAVNRGCVLQTHLFHDRIMSMDTVTLDRGATLGPHGIALPAARIGAAATVGPASLVMRGEVVPDGSRWLGNPIAPWLDGRSGKGAR